VRRELSVESYGSAGDADSLIDCEVLQDERQGSPQTSGVFISTDAF